MKNLFSAIISLFLLLPIYVLAVPQISKVPGQLEVQILEPPVPVVAENKFYLVYELYLTNFSSEVINLTAIDVKQSTDNKSLFHFDENNLKGMLTSTDKKPVDQIPLLIQPSMSKVVYMWLEFNSMNDIPNSIVHQATFLSTVGNEKQIFNVITKLVEIKKETPIRLSSPLKGKYWVATNSLSNTSNHRRTILVIHGHPYLAQRYAIDFLQINPNDGLTYHDNPNKNSNFYAYNKEVYAVVDGKVVGIKSDVPENIPHSGKTAIDITPETIGGNYVVIEAQPNKYVFFAHLIPGSNNHLHLGDTVKKGDLIGRLGNSGNSSEPHLHLHVVDSPSFIGANGIPFVFESLFMYSKKLSDTPMQYTSEKDWVHLNNQLILENSIINF